MMRLLTRGAMSQCERCFPNSQLGIMIAQTGLFQRLYFAGLPAHRRSMMQNTIRKARRLISLYVALCGAVVFPLASLALGQAPPGFGRPDSGWLYVVDSKRNASESAVLVFDPDKGRAVASFSGGYQPDIALSPDGSRLYFSYSDYENPSEGKLQVIDTSTGAVMKELPNKNRWLTDSYSYAPNVVLSPD